VRCLVDDFNRLIEAAKRGGEEEEVISLLQRIPS
jgi:hypothetical protein